MLQPCKQHAEQPVIRPCSELSDGPAERPGPISDIVFQQPIQLIERKLTGDECHTRRDLKVYFNLFLLTFKCPYLFLLAVRWGVWINKPKQFL